jgi:hypothetical protein
MISFSPQELALKGQRFDLLSYVAIDYLPFRQVAHKKCHTHRLGWHEEIRTPMTFLTGRRPAVERRATEIVPVWPTVARRL